MNSPDYEEFVALLNARGAKYLIVGAHAVAFYAQPRATKDLDLENSDSVVQLGVAPTRIDLISSLLGINDFSVAWQHRVKGQYGGTEALYISLDDLISTKRAANRGQDKVDLEHLLAAAANPS